MRTALTSLFLLAALPACFRVSEPASVALNTVVPEQKVPMLGDGCPPPSAPLQTIPNVETFNAHVGACGDLVYFDGSKNRVRDVTGKTTELAGAFEDFDLTGNMVALRVDRPEFPGSDRLVQAASFVNLRANTTRPFAAVGGAEQAGFGYDAAAKQSYGIVYKSGVTTGAIERWAPGKVYSTVNVAAPSKLVAYARRGTLVVGRQTASPHHAVVTDVASGTSTVLPIELWENGVVWMNETGELLLVQNYAETAPGGPTGSGQYLRSTKLYRPRDGALLADLGRAELIVPSQSHDPKEVREEGGTVVFEEALDQMQGGPVSPWPTAAWLAAPKTLRLAVDLETGQVLDAQKTTLPAAQGKYLGVVADGRIAYAAPSRATRAPEVVNRSGAAWLVDVATSGETQVAEFGVGSRATAVSPDGSAVIYVTEQGAPDAPSKVWRGPSLVPGFAQEPYAEGMFMSDGTAYSVGKLVHAQHSPSPKPYEWQLLQWKVGVSSTRQLLEVASDAPLLASYGNTLIVRPLRRELSIDVEHAELSIVKGGFTETFDLPFFSQVAELKPAHGRTRLLTVSGHDIGSKPGILHGVPPRDACDPNCI